MSVISPQDTNGTGELAVPTADPGRRWLILALVFVLLLAGALRFKNIQAVGICFDDEVAYTADARMWHRLTRTLFDGAAIRAALDGNRDAFDQCLETRGVDFNQRYAKPCQGYTFLAAAMMFALGDGPEALLVLNALCGTLSVLILFLLSRRVFGRGTALLAALILAVSPYHLLYCRSALAESSATLFILIGVWLWMAGGGGRRSRTWVYLFSGMALGYACTCHYKSVLIPVILVLYELVLRPVRDWEDAAPARRVRRSLYAIGFLSLGFVLPAVAFEGLLRALRLAAGFTDVHFPLATFFESSMYWADVVRQVTAYLEASAFPLPAAPSLVLAGHLLHWHGPAACTLAIVGLLATMRARGTARLPAIIIVVTLLVYTFQPYALARMNAPLLPFLSLCMAAGIGLIAARAARTRPALGPATTVLLAALLVPSAVSGVADLDGRRSHVQDACLFLDRQGAAVAAVPQGPLRYNLYLERSPIRVVEVDAGQAVRSQTAPHDVLKELRAAGVRWVITDPYCWHQFVGHPRLQWWLAFNEELRQTTELVATYTHLADHRWEFLAEIGLLDSLSEMTCTEGGPIRIYDLHKRIQTVE